MWRTSITCFTVLSIAAEICLASQKERKFPPFNVTVWLRENKATKQSIHGSWMDNAPCKTAGSQRNYIQRNLSDCEILTLLLIGELLLGFVSIFLFVISVSETVIFWLKCSRSIAAFKMKYCYFFNN